MGGQVVTRLAPSPTGALHLGNARTFLINFLLARQRGWRVRMRVEDLDGPRVRPGSAAQMLDELAWLGLQWDEPVVCQSQRGEQYAAALKQLVETGAAYPCICSRRDIADAASAPHGDGPVPAYPGTCRGRFADAAEASRRTGRPAAWRVRVDDAPIEVRDEFAGRHEFRLAHTGGDFVIFKNDGTAAYQLAVVVDDAAAGVNAVVRADDLLESAARQIHVRRLLGITPEPTYWHLPLVVGPDGRRLAKRHGDTRLDHDRSSGASPERMLGLLGHWSGWPPQRREVDLAQLLEHFDLDRVAKTPVAFSKADDDFLRGR